MKGIDKAIYELISTNAHVQAIMGVSKPEDVNVYPYNPDEDTIIPSITFYERNSDAYGGIPNCERATYKVDIWASSLEESTRMADAIDNMLSVTNLTNDYARICSFTLFTSNDAFESQTQIWHKSLTYKIIAIELQL